MRQLFVALCEPALSPGSAVVLSRGAFWISERWIATWKKWLEAHNARLKLLKKASLKSNKKKGSPPKASGGRAAAVCPGPDMTAGIVCTHHRLAPKVTCATGGKRRLVSTATWYVGASARAERSRAERPRAERRTLAR
jgi:hypothetical protein